MVIDEMVALYFGVQMKERRQQEPMYDIFGGGTYYIKGKRYSLSLNIYALQYRCQPVLDFPAPLRSNNISCLLGSATNT